MICFCFFVIHLCDVYFKIVIFLSLSSQGEMYKLFWPDQPEFVRMAAKFGATIVPFGVVGEDDLAEVSLLSLYGKFSCLFLCLISR